MQVRTVTVEMLRPGPAHNQLLSPLTQYLGICDDSEAGIVTQPYEHATFLRRMTALGYEGSSGQAERLAMLRELAYEVGKILGAIPRLPGALTADPGTPDSLIHLRLVLSASELASLPFELAKVPINPGSCADAWLSLQVRTPVVVTRRTRNVSALGVRWPMKPRILFVSADPAADSVPFDEHRALLLEAIKEFRFPGRHNPVLSADGRREQFGSLLTILKAASFDDVVAECATQRYTHVHFLAHGARDEDQGEHVVYGLGLGGTVISADRLATALTGLVDGAIQRPAVVTLATCDSGKVGSVMIPGASIAHVLHQAGIPLVIASQVPLSKAGSVLLFREFYARVLRGDDLWSLLHRLRTMLHGRLAAQTHDWASLVVYEALPDDLPAQLEEVRYRQGNTAIDATFEAVDRAVLNPAEYRALTRTLDRLLGVLPTDGHFAMECQGLRASTKKRLAQAEFRMAQALPAGSPQRLQRLEHSCFYLDEALHEYEQAVRGFLVNDRTHAQRFATMHWVMVQQLCLAAVLCKQPFSDYDGTREAAYLSANAYLDHPDIMEQCWAHGSLAELELLKLHFRFDPCEKDKHEACEQARQHAREVVRLARRANQPFAIESTRRQFERYVSWWGDPDFEQVAMDLQLGNPNPRRGGIATPGTESGAGGLKRVQRSIWEQNGLLDLARSLVEILNDRAAAMRQGAPDAAAPEPVPESERADSETRSAGRFAARDIAAGAAAPSPAAGDPPGLGAAPATPLPGAPAADAPNRAATAAAAKSTRPASRRRGSKGEPFVRIEMLPAGHGDCLLIEYGDAQRRSRVLVDCGTARTYAKVLKPRIEQLDPKDRHFELFILSHIDDDHIGGAIPLLKDASRLGLSFDDIWFNGWKHIGPFQKMLGARQGEQFSQLIRQLDLPWNVWRDAGPVVLPRSGDLPSCTLPGGLKLTLLSPSEEKLGALADEWEKAIAALGKTPGADEFLGARGTLTGSTDVEALADAPFTPDGAEANGSSIAVQAEFAGKRVLLGADAHAPVLLESIRRLAGAGGTLAIDAFKLPHHGSQNNLSSQLVQQLRCRDYLVSSSGSRFHHPDREAVARVIRWGGKDVRLHFNYDSDVNRVWKTPQLQERYGYTTAYPGLPNEPGLVVTL